jgi:hypothetical protein
MVALIRCSREMIVFLIPSDMEKALECYATLDDQRKHQAKG